MGAQNVLKTSGKTLAESPKFNLQGRIDEELQIGQQSNNVQGGGLAGIGSALPYAAKAARESQRDAASNAFTMHDNMNRENKVPKRKELPTNDSTNEFRRTPSFTPPEELVGPLPKEGHVSQAEPIYGVGSPGNFIERDPWQFYPSNQNQQGGGLAGIGAAIKAKAEQRDASENQMKKGGPKGGK